jgi:biopolymer transport protein ExbB
MNLDNMLWLAWWQDADTVVRAVFGLLAAMSLAVWTLIFYKAWQLRRLLKLEQAAAGEILQAHTMDDLQSRFPPRQPLHVLLQALDAMARQSGQPTREMLETQLNQSLRECQVQLEAGLTSLATIGNAAPFIGLFGTVWGIMHALHALGGDTALALDAIAGPVSEALVATAAGIFTAVPAVMGYNLLVRRLRTLGTVMEGNAVRLLNRAGTDAAADTASSRVEAAPLRGLTGGRG